MITVAGASADRGRVGTRGSPVPVVDVGPALDGTDPGAVAARVGEACESIGFLVVAGHGVDGSLVAAARAAGLAFFALPEAVKRRACPPDPTWFRGYEPVGVSAFGRLEGDDPPPDLCEMFRIGRFDDQVAARAAGYEPGLEHTFSPNIWPAEVPELRAALGAYYDAVEDLAFALLRLFALALDLDEEWFDDKVSRHISDLALNHYPATSLPPDPGQLRRGPHTDYGVFTVLHQDGVGGLQVWSADRGWVDVPAVPGTFVVNIGDLLARWTNDRWVSTRHRVVVPEAASADGSTSGGSTARLSMPFFFQPDYHAVIECLPSCCGPGNPARYLPTTSGQWNLERTRTQVGAPA